MANDINLQDLTEEDLEGLDEDQIEALFGFNLSSASDDFPEICLRLDSENPKEYAWAVKYFTLGGTRKIIQVAKHFYDGRGMPMNSDAKSPKNRKAMIDSGHSPNSVNPTYLVMCKVARLNKWQERARAYDNYIAKFVMQQARLNAADLGIEGLNVLADEMRHGRGIARVQAAKAIVDKVIPTVESKQVDHTLKITDARSADDDTLRQLMLAHASNKQLTAPNDDFIDGDVIPMVRAKRDENEVDTTLDEDGLRVEHDIVEFKPEFLNSVNLEEDTDGKTGSD